MSEATHQFGFIIRGPVSGERRRVDAALAHRAFCACDARANVNEECYLSSFWFGDDFREHLATSGTTAGFNGATWTPRIPFDIDRTEESGGIGKALDDTRRLVNTLDDHFGVPRETLLVYFSGRKGFGVELPTGLWEPAASIDFPNVARAFAEHIAAKAGIVIDPAVYGRVQPLRAPNSRHGKSGLHKVRIEVGILDCITVKGVGDTAREPVPFDPPTIGGIDLPDFLIAEWDKVARAVTRATEAACHQRNEIAAGARGATLNRRTRDFIAGDVAEGDRHRLLFSASRNLSEVGCPLSVALALLTEPALNLGLPPKDIERGIACGFNKGAT